jgi:OmpA-OmpF porin, OOP family
MNIKRFAAVIMTGVCAVAMVGCAAPTKSVNKPIARLPPSETVAATPKALLIPEGPVVVFFDFNSDQLSVEALKIIARASISYRAADKPTLFVEGHADRTGTDPYNEWLGLQRAEAVKSALQNQGVEGKIISTKSFGNSRPRIVTTNGVREPQNRRVEISVH